MMSEGHWQKYVRSPGLEKQLRLRGWCKRYWQSLVHIVHLRSITLSLLCSLHPLLRISCLFFFFFLCLLQIIPLRPPLFFFFFCFLSLTDGVSLLQSMQKRFAYVPEASWPNLSQGNLNLSKTKQNKRKKKKVWFNRSSLQEVKLVTTNLNVCIFIWCPCS